MATPTGTNRARPSRSLLAGAAALLLTASCSTGADSTTSTTSTTSSTTTTSIAAAGPSSSTTTTTTAAPRSKADATTVAMARAATLAADDFGTGWAPRREPAAHDLDARSCTDRLPGDRERLASGAAQDGPRMQLRDEHAYIDSTGYVFSSERFAVAWIQAVQSTEWAECTAARLQAAHEDAGLEVTLDSRQIDGLGQHGFESFAQFYGRDDAGQIELVVNVMHYRTGNVVLEDTLERSAELDAADWSNVDATHGVAVAAAWDRLNELR